jgi:hypothetical protein
MGSGGVFLARVEDVLGPFRAEASAIGHASALLSSRERERWRGIRHPGRRGEFLSARILVKYLWSSLAEPWPASGVARQVSREAIRGFLDSTVGSRAARRDCRLLQLLPGSSGAPELAWRGRPLPSLSVSLTHTGGWLAVALASGERVGVDLEKIEARSESFASVFTPAQRAWCAAQVQVPAEVSLTIVWALREAAFKAGIAGPEGREPLDIVPRGALPAALSGMGRGAWPLEPLPVDLPGGGIGLARIVLDEGFVLAHLAEDPAPVPDGLAGAWSNIGAL